MKAHYHLPGLFEFIDFYRVFLPLLQSGSPFFSMKLIYAPGGVLLETSLSENPEA